MQAELVKVTEISMRSIRICAATALIFLAVAIIIPISLSYAAQNLTPEQEAAMKKCIKSDNLCKAICASAYGSSDPRGRQDCEGDCLLDWFKCLDKAGIPRTSPKGGRDVSPGAPGSGTSRPKASPATTPKRVRDIPTDSQVMTTAPSATPRRVPKTSTDAAVTKSAATATPSPTRTKATPTPTKK
jgi:hypothetical protein